MPSRHARISPRQSHAPDRMTVAYNRTTALSKVDMAPIDKLDTAMLESIARTHRVPVAELRQRLEERRVREGGHG